MLKEIGDKSQIKKFVAKAKDKDDPFRLMGFGHRVYKNFDPRATIIRDMCHKVLAQLGRDDTPMFDLALLLLRHHLSRARHSNVHVYGHVRDWPLRWLDGALARDDRRFEYANRTSKAAVHGCAAARLRRYRKEVSAELNWRS